MSSTAPSFIDDATSLSHRLPLQTPHHPPPHHTSSTSYTGSYIDDGLDLLPPTPTHNLGTPNPTFYKSKARKKRNEAGVWSPDIARAVSGDVKRNLDTLKKLGGIEVRKAIVKGEEEERRGVVFVPKPVRWGTFVIKSKNGRVVVVGEEGEWDSGVVGGHKEGLGRMVEGGRREDVLGQRDRWVRAPSTVSDTTTVPQAVDESTMESSGAHGSEDCNGWEDKQRIPRRRPQLRPDPDERLDPVPESEFDSDDPVAPSSLASPTDFFMTGGLSGWPSCAASSKPASTIMPHAITWETSPVRSSFRNSQSRTHTKTVSKRSKKSKKGKKKEDKGDEQWTSTPSSHGGRPTSTSPRHISPPPYNRASTVTRTSRRLSPLASIFEMKNTLQKADSNYHSPDIVEVIYDETPPGEVAHSQTGWRSAKHSDWHAFSNAPTQHRVSSHEGNDLGWGGSVHNGATRDSEWVESVHGTPVEGSVWGGSQVGSRIKSHTEWRSEGSQAGSDVKSVSLWDDGQHACDEVEWDGFERPKTRSEVSVYGGSARSRCSQGGGRSRSSQASWPTSDGHRRHRNEQTHRSARSHKSYGSRHSSTAWAGEESRSTAGSAVPWNGGGGVSVQNWAA